MSSPHSASPERGQILVDVLKELQIQRNLIHELLRSERPSEAGNLSPSLARLQARLPSPARLLSPTPDRENNRTPEKRLMSPRRGSDAGVAAVDPAIADLMEALSTSTWSSDTSDDASDPVFSTPRSGATSPSGATGSTIASRNQFFVAAFRVVEQEYDQRQALMLDEVIGFTELSSAFVGGLFAARGAPQHL